MTSKGKPRGRMHILRQPRPACIHLPCFTSHTMLSLLIFLSALYAPALAGTVVYDWDITWVSASPDNFTRPVIGINGKWPCPLVEVEMGDRLIVNLHNGLGNQSTGLHWHGLYQKGTNVMDGSTGESQCPVPPGHSVTYDFFVRGLSCPVEAFLTMSRSTSQEPTGIIPTTWANTPMVCAVL